MKKPVRPFAARIPFDDQPRQAIARALDKRQELDLNWISQNVLGRNHAYMFQYLFKRTPAELNYSDAVKLRGFLGLDGGASRPESRSRMGEHLQDTEFKGKPGPTDALLRELARAALRLAGKGKAQALSDALWRKVKAYFGPETQEGRAPTLEQMERFIRAEVGAKPKATRGKK
ncbi:MAG: hypothetical protein SFW62_05820 [Alphaproteobacteria bacterium]|nr:hypothetical protein [Alphaproteobacteria bacterium]